MSHKTRDILNSTSEFMTRSLDTLLQQHLETNIQRKFIDFARQCAKNIPAYRALLNSLSISPDTIQSFEGFQTLPLTSKSNYINQYALPLRCVNSSFSMADRISVSSGSTGVSTFWPRSFIDELDIALRFEQVFKDSFEAHNKSTLAVVCFAMGNWVGGMFTTSCCWHLSAKGYRLLTTTPGNKSSEIIRVIRDLSPHFEQTVLLGYPPYLKDVIEEGILENLNWQEINTKLVFAGEVFSEEWRSLIYQKIGYHSYFFDSSSLYGTADGGVLGNETPFSIAIRKWLSKQPNAAKLLFGESRLPTLVQYDPYSRFFETHENTLVVSADTAHPLIRYHIADKGGLISYQEMWSFLNQFNIATPKDLGLPIEYQPRILPFVFVFGRADFTVSFYGANIFPEHIAIGLEQAAIAEKITGKFVLETRDTSDGNKILYIAIELLPNASADLQLSDLIAQSIHNHLLRLNSEFANYTPIERQLPMIELYSYEDLLYFPSGVKHRYTRQGDQK